LVEESLVEHGLRAGGSRLAESDALADVSVIVAQRLGALVAHGLHAAVSLALSLAVLTH